MQAGDILDVVKSYLESTIKRSQKCQKKLEADFFEETKDYLNGFYDGVINHCDELLDLIRLLSKPY